MKARTNYRIGIIDANIQYNSLDYPLYATIPFVANRSFPRTEKRLPIDIEKTVKIIICRVGYHAEEFRQGVQVECSAWAGGCLCSAYRQPPQEIIRSLLSLSSAGGGTSSATMRSMLVNSLSLPSPVPLCRDGRANRIVLTDMGESCAGLNDRVAMTDMHRPMRGDLREGDVI